MARQIRIGLLWHSPASRNLGIGALTIANIAISREVATSLGLEPKFCIIGSRESGRRYVDDATAEQYQIDTRGLLRPSGYARVASEQDCLLDIGAGDSFTDIYGWKRFAFLWLTKMIAIWQGKPLAFAPQTIGPFHRQPYKWLARMALTGAQRVVARDQISLDACRDLAPKANAVLAVDVAFALPYDDHSSLRGGKRLRVGVNVSGLLFNEAESGRNRFGLSVDYSRLMRRFIGELAARDDVEVHLISHASHISDGWDDDGRVADRLAVEFPAAVRVPDFAGPCEAKSYISGLDFLVAGRMHACIAAFSSGTPVVPVAYSRKFSGLFGLLDYEWMLPVKGYDDDQALSYLRACLDQRTDLARDEARGMARVSSLLDGYRAVLRELFATSVGGQSR